MPPTLRSPKSNNWVDRGEAPDATLRRALAHHFGRHEDADAPWLQQEALTVLGMVAADANEVQLTAYLRTVARQLGHPEGEPHGTRFVAMALWHVAKAALVRDLAERVIRGDVPVNAPTGTPLGEWLAARILSPEELEAHEAERAAARAQRGGGGTSSGSTL